LKINATNLNKTHSKYGLTLYTWWILVQYGSSIRKVYYLSFSRPLYGQAHLQRAAAGVVHGFVTRIQSKSDKAINICAKAVLFNYRHAGLFGEHRLGESLRFPVLRKGFSQSVLQRKYYHSWAYRGRNGKEVLASHAPFSIHGGKAVFHTAGITPGTSCVPVWS